MSALTPRKMLCLTLAASSALVALSACGSPRQPQTYKPRYLGDAANANLNELALRAVSVLTPPDGETYLAGADATLVFTIANQGATQDELLSIRTSGARSVVLNDSARLAGAATLAPSRPARSTVVKIPAYGAANSATALLVGLAEPLRAGNYLTVTFVFRNSGTKDVDVPVEVGNSPAPRSNVEPSKEAAPE